MSEITAQAKVSELLGMELTDAEMGWEMISLMEAIDFNYERWCRILDQDPDDQEVDDFAGEVHQAWADSWMQVGTEEFDRQTRKRVRAWRLLLGEQEKAKRRR